jgi:glycosyltransferase involved in cell wall biosynthesis
VGPANDICRERPAPGACVGLIAPLPPQIGGVATFAEWLLRNAREIGLRYETFDLRRSASDEIGGRVSLRSLGRQALLLIQFVGWTRRAPKLVHYCVAFTLTGLARDLVFVIVLRLARKEVIAHLHSVDPRRRHSRARALGLRLLAKLTRERVVVTPRAAAFLAEIGVSSRHVPNPIRFNLDQVTEHVARPGFEVLFVGAYGDGKGCPDLVDAVAAARARGVDARLRFVGKEQRRGDERRLEDQAGRNGLRGVVEFTGPCDADRLLHHYAEADVICLPSKREGLSMALLEAMAFGLPAVATAVGGIPDLVEHERTGLLIEPGDVDGLTEAICFLARDREASRRMGAAARERVLALAGRGAVTRAWRRLYAEVGTA